MTTRRIRRALACLALLVACEGPAGPNPAPVAAPMPQPPPMLVVGGCAERTEAVCTLAGDQDQPLVVWLDLPIGARVAIDLDGAAVETTPVEVDGGQRWRLTIAAAVDRMHVRGVDPPWTEPIELTFEREPVDPLVLAALAGRVPALASLDAAVRERTGLQRLQLLLLLARIDREHALAHAGAAAELARALDRPRDEADAAAIACDAKLRTADPDGVATWCGRLSAAARRAPEITHWAEYYDGGRRASLRGDPDDALRHYRLATRWSLRVADVVLATHASGQAVLALAALGRIAQARAAARDAVALADDPAIGCRDRANFLGNLTWQELMLAPDDGSAELPYDLIEQTLADADVGGRCPTPRTAHNALLNLAYAELLAGEPARARQVLDRLRFDEDASDWQDWLDEFSAMAELAEGRWDRLTELAPIPRGDADLMLLARLRHAQTLERTGLHAAAIAAYTAIEDELDEAVRMVGADAGQDRWLARRTTSSDRLVDLLVADGQLAEATCRARLAASRPWRALDRQSRFAALDPIARAAWMQRLAEHRALRGRLESEAREDWRLSGDALARAQLRRRQQLDAATATIDGQLGAIGAPPRCDELPLPVAARPLLLALGTGDRDRALLASQAGLAAVELPAGADAQAWARALAPWIGDDGEIERLTVIATGRATTIRFHALELAAAPVLARVEVAYGSDLPPLAIAAAPRAVSIVGDPRGDLEAARSEAERVAELWSTRDREVVLRVGEQATRAAVVDDLCRSELFHYAGHGVRADGGWEDALLLAEGAALHSADVLTLPRVPTHVVLAGCKTGALDDEGLAGGLNLGRAFLLAGSTEVIVADSDVPDAITRAVAERLYADELDDTDLVTRLRRAQLELRAQAPHSPWAAFRVLVR